MNDVISESFIIHYYINLIFNLCRIIFLILFLRFLISNSINII